MEIVDIILYAVIFITGAMFGSFYTLAVYRIPRGEDIIKTNSYCPKCKHKLGILDLIPILSYIFLGAKCRYCKEKIRPRYFILEILSGLTFIGIAYLMKLSVFTLNIRVGVKCIVMIFYFTFLVLIAGMDKENKEIPKQVIGYGIVISIMYMVYLCIVEEVSIYKYAIYLSIYAVILIADTIKLRKFAKNSYFYNLILVVITILIFTGERMIVNTLIYTIIAITIVIILKKVFIKKDKNKEIEKTYNQDCRLGKGLPIVYIMCTMNFLGIIQSLMYLKK